MRLSIRQLQVLKAAPNSAYDLFKPEFLFHSNKMEGSTFSELELQRLVDEGIVLGQHTINDVLETRNLGVREAIQDVARSLPGRRSVRAACPDV